MSLHLSKKSADEAKDQNRLVPEGNYEVIVTNYTLDSTKTGKDRISFALQVRKDLDNVKDLMNAKTHGRLIFANIYSDENGQFKESNISMIAEAAGIIDDKHPDLEIDSVKDFADLVKGKNVHVYVGLNENTYNGQTRKQNSIFANNWSKTKYPTQTTQTADPFAENSGISDEEKANIDKQVKKLPF